MSDLGAEVERRWEAAGIPAINITIHSPNANHVLESEICQLADIQESIQRMREGELVGVEKQAVESRLSSSCPSLAIESGAETGETRETPRRRGRGGGGHGKAGHRATGNGGQ